MKRLVQICFLFSFCFPFLAKAQSSYYDVRQGNVKYADNDYEAAEQFYRESLRKDPKPLESAFNLGDALYRQGKYEEAAKYFSAAAKKAETEVNKANAYHNLGNSLLKSQKLEESIEAYKKALINNPKDEDSRYNLAYAKQQLQEQQQEQQQNQDKDKEDQKEQEEKEEEQQNQEEENQKEEQNKEQQQEEQQKQEEQQQQEEQQKQQEQEQQVSREDAERILEALQEQEKEVQEKLKKKKGKAVEIQIEKDW